MEEWVLIVSWIGLVKLSMHLSNITSMGLNVWFFLKRYQVEMLSNFGLRFKEIGILLANKNQLNPF